MVSEMLSFDLLGLYNFENSGIHHQSHQIKLTISIVSVNTLPSNCFLITILGICNIYDDISKPPCQYRSTNHLEDGTLGYFPALG